MKIVVTGATGFIGSHLVENLLERGYDTSVLVRSPTTQRRYRLSWLNEGRAKVFHGDVTDASKVEEAVKGADVVFHLAALLGRWGIPEQQYFRVNVFGTQVVLKQSAKANVDQVIYLSSTGVMGRLKSIPGDVSDPCNPTTPYERSKYQAELLVKRGITEKNIPATVVRSTHVYGPGDPHTLQLYKMMKKWKILPLVGGGKNLFQPIYVTDLVLALISCMENKEASGSKVYIVAGNRIVTFREFLMLSARTMNVATRDFNVPTALAQMVGTFSEKACQFLGLTPVITQSRIEFFTRSHVYNTSQIMSDLGWSPKTEIETGLRESIEWYGAQGLL